MWLFKFNMKTLLYFLTLGSVYCFPLKAQWSTNPSINNPISVATNDQLTPKIISDNAGGAIMVWNDYRNATTSYIYAQRINSTGVVQWNVDGEMLGKSVSYNKRPAITADGFGGAIISWVDSSGTGITLYMQRLNSLGVQQWAPGGIVIAAINSNYMSSPELLSDGSGGATVTWADDRTNTNLISKIYVQHVNSAGNTLYNTNGLAISSNSSVQFSPKLISDGASGAIITYSDFRNGFDVDVYAQRINSSGVIQWPLDGIAISTAANNQSDPKLISDGSGGAIIIWQDLRTGIYDIYYQHINTAGVVQWANNGLVLSASTSDKIYPAIVDDGIGGFFVAWQQFGSGQSFFDMYVQRVNQSGIALWTTNGNGIGVGLYDQQNADIITDGSGGVIVTWEGYTGPNNFDIRAQRINSLGVNLWPTNGAFVTTNPDHQNLPALISDGASGAIVVWQDYRPAPNYDIYAQKIPASGVICNSAPSSPGLISGSVSVCPNSSQNYSVVNDNNVSNYTWILPNGWNGTSSNNGISVLTNTASGVIQVTGSNACGTSAITTLSVNVSPLIDVSVTSVNNVLTVATTGASYQWYTCPNNIFAPGIFYNQSYTVATNGDYAVTVTLNGCTNTSSCVTVLNVGMNELSEVNHYLNFSVFPSPTKSDFTVKTDNIYKKTLNIFNNMGALVFATNFSSEQIELNLNLYAGIYFVEIIIDGIKQQKKLVIQ